MNESTDGYVTYDEDSDRFVMTTEAGEAFVTVRHVGEEWVLPHAEVPPEMRGTGAGAKLAKGTFALIERMGVAARPTCPFLVRVARSDERWRTLFAMD